MCAGCMLLCLWHKRLASEPLRRTCSCCARTPASCCSICCCCSDGSVTRPFVVTMPGPGDSGGVPWPPAFSSGGSGEGMRTVPRPDPLRARACCAAPLVLVVAGSSTAPLVEALLMRVAPRPRGVVPRPKSSSPLSAMVPRDCAINSCSADLSGVAARITGADVMTKAGEFTAVVSSASVAGSVGFATRLLLGLPAASSAVRTVLRPCAPSSHCLHLSSLCSRFSTCRSVEVLLSSCARTHAVHATGKEVG
jgi:hypothetical protein